MPMTGPSRVSTGQFLSDLQRPPRPCPATSPERKTSTPVHAPPPSIMRPVPTGATTSCPSRAATRPMTPLIGIAPSQTSHTSSHGVFERYVLSNNYPSAVIAAGGIPVILPPQTDNATALLDRLDGLLL